MRTVALLLAALPAVAAITWQELQARPDYSYDHWVAEGYGARHPGTRSAFEANLRRIRLHNSNTKRTWHMGVNAYTALTPAEFKHKVIGQGYNPNLAGALKERGLAAPADAFLSTIKPVEALPASVDWRTKSVVTAVKDQGMCGGCWSFSAAETVESAVAIATGHLMVLSEQQILSCSSNPNQCGGTGGCNGATQEIAFEYVINAGLSLESAYPYAGVTGKCDAAKIQPAANITGYVFLPPNNYTALMNAVAEVGPIAISVAAEPWQFYSGGVFSDSCGTDVDHAVQLVGYGHDANANLDYYIIRNSWSADWGESGYIRLARYGSTPNGEPCGTDTTPGDGDGCKGGPSSINVCGLCGVLSDSSYPTGASLVQA